MYKGQLDIFSMQMSLFLFMYIHYFLTNFLYIFNKAYLRMLVSYEHITTYHFLLKQYICIYI